MARYAQIVGWGHYVPERVVTNEDLAQLVDTSDEWIRTRTGIRERRIAANPEETTADLAERAARIALRVADIPPDRIDLIIVGTTTPDHQFPATACLVQDRLGATRAGAFDLSAACSSFVYALGMARSMILSGDVDTALVIGAETLSRIVDWNDRNTCVLFGDGAGAVVLQASETPGGVLATELGSDGSGGNLLILPAGGSARPATLETVAARDHYIKMEGRPVFRFATRVMASATQRVVEQAGWRLEDVNLIVPHQANIRIIETSARQLKLDMDHFFVNLDLYGNTSAASIPIALSEAVAQGRIRQGDNVVVVAFGGGLTWGAAAIHWAAPLPTRPVSWWRRLYRRYRYLMARLGSGWRRIIRRVYSITLGPPDLESWRGRLRIRLERPRLPSLRSSGESPVGEISESETSTTSSLEEKSSASEEGNSSE
ncbi:MAG TPA: ketoacyl-ACP synthase III [Anaerolineae bacterium]|nr:ketoacyl-ACP synthase III [Anaerolineae bacterium]